MIEAALAIRERMVAQNPSVTLFQDRLASSHHILGVLLDETGDPEVPRDVCQSAISIRERLVEQNPTVTRYQRDLARSHFNLGNLLSRTGALAGAGQAYPGLTDDPGASGRAEPLLLRVSARPGQKPSQPRQHASPHGRPRRGPAGVPARTGDL